MKQIIVVICMTGTERSRVIFALSLLLKTFAKGKHM